MHRSHNGCANGLRHKNRTGIAILYVPMAGNAVKETTIPMNTTLDVAMYFVTQVLNREWTPADFHGRHMKAAKILTGEMGYEPSLVKKAILAAAKREYWKFGLRSDSELPSDVTGLEFLYMWGEPPLIHKYPYPPEIPEVYSADYDRWIRRWGKRAIELGMWDGIYVKDNPGMFAGLSNIIGLDRYSRSLKLWGSMLSQRRRQSLETSPQTQAQS